MTHRRGWWWRVGSSRGLDRAGATRATALHGAHPISAPVKYRYMLEGGARGTSAPDKRGTVAMRRPERHQQHAREGHKNALAFFCSSCRGVGKGVSLPAKWILLHHRYIGNPRGGALRGCASRRKEESSRLGCVSCFQASGLPQGSMRPVCWKPSEQAKLGPAGKVASFIANS